MRRAQSLVGLHRHHQEDGDVAWTGPSSSSADKLSC